jgi:hypothetical protein
MADEKAGQKPETRPRRAVTERFGWEAGDLTWHDKEQPGKAAKEDKQAPAESGEAPPAE